MNMNGGTSTSATDPHHRSSGYLGMGIPGLGSTPMTPSSGNGFVGANLSGLGMSGGAVGPELKHHADFLSRLLAATPSYASEVGNPPPGFFSDWLRRLVSKPNPGNGNSTQHPQLHHHHHRGRGGTTSPQNMSNASGPGPSSTPTSIHQQTSSLTYSPTSGHGESNGVGVLESTTQTGNGGGTQGAKRRKRTRISDHHLHLPHQQQHSGKDPASVVGETSSPSPLSSHLNHNQNSLVSSALTSTLSGSSSSSAVAAAAAASLNPFNHPLWFFPPFLPNPYLSPMNMNMGMNIPGLLPPPGVPPPGSTGTPPYLSSGLGGTVSGLSSSDNLLSSYRTSTDNLLHAHHHHHRQFNSHTDLSLNSMKKDGHCNETLSKTQTQSKRNSGKGSKKSSSFSISRLTSPSPSSNSSGGSHTSKSSNHNNNNFNHQHHSGGGMIMGETGKTTSLGLGSEMSMSRMPMVKGGRDKGNSDSGSETGASGGGGGGGSGSSSGLCVDLRVSGRIWEKSGVTAPPPRSIYKPLSAFHDPADVNLTHSSQQPPRSSSSPDNFSSLRSLSTVSGRGGTTKSLQEQKQKMIPGDHMNLSTTYVLKNLHHIYLRVKGSSHNDSFIPGTINNNSHITSCGSNTTSPYKNHHFHQEQPQHSRTSPHPNTTPTPTTLTLLQRKESSHHSFNYSDSDESNNDMNHTFGDSIPLLTSSDLIEDEKKKVERKKVIDLDEIPFSTSNTSISREIIGRKIVGGERKRDGEIKIPFPRPIKVEPNYSSGGNSTSGIKRAHDSSSPPSTKNSFLPTSSSHLSFDEDEDEKKIELRPSKPYKYGNRKEKSKSIPQSPSLRTSDNENEEEDDGGGSDELVNILSDETENEDEGLSNGGGGGVIR